MLALTAAPVMAAEGSGTGNGSSTLSGPAGTGSEGQSNRMGTTSSGRSMSPAKAANPGSQGESNGTSTIGGPANK